jgi:hypothetical protein
MENLLKKTQIIQFIIIISFFILSNTKKEENILNKNTKYYNFLVNIVKYNSITKKFVKKNNKSVAYIDKYKLLLENNEYFYIFYNNNVYVYLFKENGSNEHIIYFNGINNINDIKIIVNTIFDIINSNFNFNNIEKLLNKKGLLYRIEKNNVHIIDNKYSILDVFDYLYNNNYIYDKSTQTENKINLKINGFSLGGPISQLFTLLLIEKYDKKLNIDMYNVESWFGGNEEIYNHMKNKINICNIYSEKSVFYFFNIFFQKYFKSNYLINSDEEEYIENKILLEYNTPIFPIGIVKYVIDNHLLSKILK